VRRISTFLTGTSDWRNTIAGAAEQNALGDFKRKQTSTITLVVGMGHPTQPQWECLVRAGG
jgi:hypothetical protein